MWSIPEHLVLIAGRGAYPVELALSAKHQGVRRLSIVAFKKESDPALDRLADDIAWIHLGQYGALLQALSATGARQAVMAGQITPTHLFTVRMDKPLLDLLARLPVRNAETIFGAVGEDLRKIGIDLLPASRFMEKSMPGPGLLSRRPPTDEETRDIALGLNIAKATSRLEIGQTVVVKRGTILAVEAFEGTDACIARAGELGGPGAVIVKVAREDHDMRFDIPVIGPRTLKGLKQIQASALAVEAGRAILLEREKTLQAADAINLAFVVLDTGVHHGGS